MTYDDLDPTGSLPGQSGGTWDAGKYAHNGSLDYARINGYFGH